MANEENLIKWKPGQSGNPAGRPKRSFRLINDKLKEEGIEQLKKRDLIEAYGLIFNSNESDLKAIASDPETPLAMRIIILDLNDKKRRSVALQDYRDYMFGKAQSKQIIEAGKGTKIKVNFLNDEE